MQQSLGSRIRQLRIQQGLSSADLAGFLHISENTVLLWETDQLTPELSLISQLADQLHTTPEDLTCSIQVSARCDIPGKAGTLWIPFLLSILGWIAAIIVNTFRFPMIAFWVGAIPTIFGIGIQLRRFSFRWRSLPLFLAFSALLPLLLTDGYREPVSALQWLTFGIAFAAITAIAYGIAVLVMSADRSGPGSVHHVYLRYLLILFAAVLALGLLHFLTYRYLENSQLLYPNLRTFDDWTAFQNYMQTPLSSDGITMLSLLSIEHADDNLTYRFSDALGNILVISNAQKTILDPAGMDVLCTYLDLNQFVHTITLSSTGTLPVQITTLQDIAHAQRIFQIVNLSFCSLYFVIPTVLFLFLRRKIRKTNK